MAKKAAPRVEPEEAPILLEDVRSPEESLTAAATQLALDWLYREAFKYGARHHTRIIVDQAQIPREVKAVLLEVIERNND